MQSLAKEQVQLFGRKKKLTEKEWFWAYLFIAPMVLGVFLFSIYPIIYSFFVSFNSWDGMGERIFVGLANYKNLFTDEKISFEIANTLKYTFLSVPFTLLIALGVANLLNKGIKGTGAFRIFYFLPNITMPVAIALVWKFIFNSKFGLVNTALTALHFSPPAWLGDPNYILYVPILVTIWCGVGYNVVILLAGLQSVPKVLYEAAEIDGARPSTMFWRITFPLLTPTIFFLLTTNIMNSLRSFDIIYAFTFNGQKDSMGGPLLSSLRTLVYGIYEKAFHFLEMGAASAQSVFLFSIILFVTLLQFYFQKKWVFYND